MDTFITAEGYRFILATKNTQANLNWVFLPGGPGLGSEYYINLLKDLQLPGKAWRLDFPGDGSNLEASNNDYPNWAKNLTPALNTLENIILVCHSFSGMFCLTIPELENCLTGFIIMDSAPNKYWREAMLARAKTYGIESDADYRNIRESCNNDSEFKQQTLAGWRFFMNAESRQAAKQLLESLPYNYSAYAWAQINFHPSYECLWIPENIPTLILAGSDDVLTPLSLFQNDSRFQRENIQMREVAGASHFPWIEQPEFVKQLFVEFFEHVYQLNK